MVPHSFSFAVFKSFVSLSQHYITRGKSAKGRRNKLQFNFWGEVEQIGFIIETQGGGSCTMLVKLLSILLTEIQKPKNKWLKMHNVYFEQFRFLWFCHQNAEKVLVSQS